MVFVAGSSAGAHLASLAALTSKFQPGFEQCGTTVCHGHCSAVFVVHGDPDTVVSVEDARRFAARLGTTSASAVVYAELPGAQHSFDLFHSLRFERVVDAVEGFAAWVRPASE